MRFGFSDGLARPRAANQRSGHIGTWLVRVPLAALLVVMLSSLIGCRGTDAGKDDAAQSQRAAEPTQAPPGATVVRLDPAAEQRLHLQVASLASTVLQPEVNGYGNVLDAAPLAALCTEFAAARAAADASSSEYQRVKMLASRDNASARTLEAARAAAERDRLLVESARARIALSWGRAIAERNDLPDLVRRLSTLEDVLVRIDLPAGAALPSEPASAQLKSLRGETAPAQFLSRAPSTAPQTQGQGFLFLMKNSLRLAPGAAVTGDLALRDAPVPGLIVPRSAVLRHQERTWVYVEVAPHAFQRRPVELTVPANSGWLVREGLNAGDRILVSGAQVLLSDELKSQLQLGD
jgi:hypothetical protein